MIKTATTQPTLYVFENDLRIEGNPLLNQACAQAQTNNSPLLCLYCLQPWQFEAYLLEGNAMGGARYEFLWQSLADLRNQLQTHGLSLVVRIGQTEQVVDELHDQFQFSHIYHNRSAGFYERSQWNKLAMQLPAVNFKSAHNSSLFTLDQLPFELTALPKHFTPFRKQVENLTIQQLQAFIGCHETPHNFDVLDHWAQLPAVKSADSQANDFRGGEHAGQQHLDDYFSSQAPSSYKQVRNQLLGWRNSTKFSPWLALGCVSPTQIMHKLKEYETEQGANDSTYWIYFELLWREFFYWYGLKQGHQLFQHQAQANLEPQYTEEFRRWCRGQTGADLIDGCMRQLNQTGYLSNRGRQIAASYLIHELATDWRLGASYFERMLIDYDVASNWGNWQNIAGVGADPRGGRHFNLEKQQQTHDPEGQFVQQWATFKATRTAVQWRDLLG